MCLGLPSPGYGPKCRTVYETHYKTIYETTYEPKCSTSYEKACETVYETSYETDYKEKCYTAYQSVCEKTYRQVDRIGDRGLGFDIIKELKDSQCLSVSKKLVFIFICLIKISKSLLLVSLSLLFETCGA